jgi:4-hydroxy-tetrahydrodipicolinate reductase
MATQVGVLGAYGRMGAAATAALETAEDLDLVARLGSGDARSELTDAGTQVAVDLTRPDAVMDNVRFCLEHGIHVVVGTSGMSPDRLAEVESWLAGAPGVGVVVAPNFAVGAVLMMRFAAQAAPWFESVEIVELHHPDKADAPSGTARRTAELVAAPAGRPVSDRCRTRPRATPTALGGRTSTACTCTRCVPGGWWPARRCCSAVRGRRSLSGTTPPTVRPSCPECCSRCARSGRAPA